MDRWRGKTAVVTGASSGIGEAITGAFLQKGVNVAGLDIQEEKLVSAAEKWKKEGAPGTLHPIRCDVTSEQDIENAFHWIEDNLNGVDIMVNNAGISNYARVIGHEIPNGFISEDEGVNGWNLYPACKHATVALTHTVRRELAAVKAPIRITSISPGLVKTEICKHSLALKDFYEKVPALNPEDVADAVIYALGTRPAVQITELTIRRTGEV